MYCVVSCATGGDARAYTLVSPTCSSDCAWLVKYSPFSAFQAREEQWPVPAWRVERGTSAVPLFAVLQAGKEICVSVPLPVEYVFRAGWRLQCSLPLSPAGRDIALPQLGKGMLRDTRRQHAVPALSSADASLPESGGAPFVFSYGTVRKYTPAPTVYGGESGFF